LEFYRARRTSVQPRFLRRASPGIM